MFKKCIVNILRELRENDFQRLAARFDYFEVILKYNDVKVAPIQMKNSIDSVIEFINNATSVDSTQNT
jgi:hypothetical protein